MSSDKIRVGQLVGTERVGTIRAGDTLLSNVNDTTARITRRNTSTSEMRRMAGDIEGQWGKDAICWRFTSGMSYITLLSMLMDTEKVRRWISDLCNIYSCI